MNREERVPPRVQSEGTAFPPTYTTGMLTKLNTHMFNEQRTQLYWVILRNLENLAFTNRIPQHRHWHQQMGEMTLSVSILHWRTMYCEAWKIQQRNTQRRGIGAPTNYRRLGRGAAGAELYLVNDFLLLIIILFYRIRWTSFSFILSSCSPSSSFSGVQYV